MRTGGAAALASLGVDPSRIQAMGRWRSNLVIRYAGEHAADGITQQTATALRSASPPAQPSAIYIPDQPDSHPPPDLPRQLLMMHNDTGRLHVTTNGRTTLCGGRIAEQTHTYVQSESDFSLGSYCAKCLPNSASEVLVASDSEDD